MAITREIKLESLVRINDPRPKATPKVLGQWPGNETTPMRVLVNSVIRTTETMMRGAYDCRANRNLGPLEVSDRLQEISAPALKDLNTHATALRTKREALRDAVRAINPTKQYEKCGHWQAAIDLRVIDSFQRQSPSQKAAMKAQLLADPLSHWDLADACLRLPAMVSGLDHAERRTIKTKLFERLKPDEFNAIQEQIEQVNFAEGAVRVAVEAAVDTTGSGADVASGAPAALALAQSDAAPLGWDA